MSKKISVLEIFIYKVQIFAENSKSGVQRSGYISRTVNANENLIRSEPTENFLLDCSNLFFHSSSSSGRNFDFFPKGFSCLCLLLLILLFYRGSMLALACLLLFSIFWRKLSVFWCNYRTNKHLKEGLSVKEPKMKKVIKEW